MEKAVLFDLDGTLLDTLSDIAYYTNQMLEHFGYPIRSNLEIMQFIGCGSRNLIKKSLPEGLEEDRVSVCHAYYNKIYTESNSPRTCLFDGISQVVKEIKSRGYKIAILTNKPQETTDTVYQRYLSDIGFDAVVGQSAAVKVKPDPTAALELAKRFGAKTNDVYFVGDGETDVQTAINANMNGIAVLWGYRSKLQLQAAGATVFASEPKDLLKLIK